MRVAWNHSTTLERCLLLGCDEALKATPARPVRPTLRSSGKKFSRRTVLMIAWGRWEGAPVLEAVARTVARLAKRQKGLRLCHMFVE